MYSLFRYIASGTHVAGGQKYRFLVMERFGSDLQRILDNRFVHTSSKRVKGGGMGKKRGTLAKVSPIFYFLGL